MGVIRKAIADAFTRGKYKILRGDQVAIMAGKDKGQVGTVTKVIRDHKVPRVIVEGLNLVSIVPSGLVCWRVIPLCASSRAEWCLLSCRPSGISSEQKTTLAG